MPLRFVITIVSDADGTIFLPRLILKAVWVGLLFRIKNRNL